jgi:hypothetical protein
MKSLCRAGVTEAHPTAAGVGSTKSIGKNRRFRRLPTRGAEPRMELVQSRIVKKVHA